MATRAPPPRRRRRWLLATGLLWLASALWQAWKPLPDGVGVAGPWRAAEDVSFLSDLTWVDDAGVRHSQQSIFDTALAMIAQAQTLVVLDMFLFNAFGADGSAPLRPLSAELTNALLDRKARVPALHVVVVTDPVNTVYGGQRAPHLEQLKQAGAEVIITDLRPLRASNPVWSGAWALCCAWLGNNAEGGWLPNPLGAEPLTLRSWLALPNFRANHRKTLVVDSADGWQALVTSANPHDGSSAHGNVALRFAGAAALDVVASEAAVATLSGAPLSGLPAPSSGESATRDARLRVLGEGAIEDALLDTLAAASAGERVDIAVFYLADREVIAAMKSAHRRGVALRVLLDPNEDAFGRKKNGVPNRQVARELVNAGVSVRWCHTHGEQCHAKLLMHHGRSTSTLILGSANFTRRNLDNLYLETSVQLVAPAAFPAMADATRWFDSQWTNPPGQHFSIDYARYADDALLRRLWYRVGESLGLSTW